MFSDLDVSFFFFFFFLHVLNGFMLIRDVNEVNSNYLLCTYVYIHMQTHCRYLP